MKNQDEKNKEVMTEKKVFTREEFVQWGKRGGERTKTLHGINHFKKIRGKRKSYPQRTSTTPLPVQKKGI